MSHPPEFEQPFEPPDEPGRRQILKAMGASFGLAGLTACTEQPDTRAIPYVHTPEFTVPDKARHYATAVVTVGGYAQPVLGETHVGRPTKLEGLPGHPAVQGAADAFTQAAMAGLYDPDRSKGPLYLGKPCDWSAFDAAMITNAGQLDAKGGEGFWLLTGQQTSPTFARRIAAMKQRWPKAQWCVWEHGGDYARLAASQQVFGKPCQLLPAFDRADVVVSLDDDFLGPGPAQTRNARLWTQHRRAFQQGGPAQILFVAEPTPSLTGVVADDRLACEDGRLPALLQGLSSALGDGTAPALSARESQWVNAAAAALKANGPGSLVTAGPHQPVDLQAAALALTSRLGGVGKSLVLAEPFTVQGAQSLFALAEALNGGQVDTLVLLDVNPAYTAPGLAVAKARLIVHAGLHLDETGTLAHWHAPLEHSLETWSDARAADGTASVIQPLVQPFYSVRSPHVILEDVQGQQGSTARELVMATWQTGSGGEPDTQWQTALQRGWIESSAPALATASAHQMVPISASAATDALELIVRPDPCVWDGRFANNPYLQELPKPLTTLTWDNALLISPGLARQLDLKNGDEVRATVNGQSLIGPVWIVPGQARRSVVAALGYGRRLPGHTADGYGFDAYPLAAGGPVTLAKTGKRMTLAVAQEQQVVEGPDPIPVITRAAAAQPPKPKAKTLSFYPDQPQASQGPSWGMVIDTDVCIGCNACVSACDIENNVVMVGKDQTAEGRWMHWLRIDHYVAGEEDDAHIAFQPVPCMHCEQAPCEIGCPVHATVHGADGLNLQVYNRCIGTRTCSSYCPYKVRRFNWFDWTHKDPPERRAQRNPNVTVRTRGVMEKCTYCIQRISDARIQAKLENRPIRDNEIKTACQQTCPTNAIVFGDVTDPATEVSKLKAQGRNYVLLEEMNTRPRTSYLKRLKPDGEA